MRRHVRHVVIIAIAACSSAPSREVDHPAPKNVVAGGAASRRPPAPTLVTAGAVSCTLGNAIRLGVHRSGNAALGFTTGGGVAAWASGETELSIRPLARDGTLLGKRTTTDIAEAAEAIGIEPTASGFAIIVERHSIATSTLWRVDVDANGHVLNAATPIDAAAAARLHDAPPLGEVEYTITNAATPPPPGPGGQIIEAMGRPVLARTQGDGNIGNATALEVDGNPIAHGMNVSTDIAWSGTHFIYPFWIARHGIPVSIYMVELLPIDCRPRT